MRLNEAEQVSQQLIMCVYENNKHLQQLSMCVYKNNKHLDNLLWDSSEHKQVYDSLKHVNTTNKQHCLSQDRQHTWLFLLVLNLLYIQSFISFHTLQLQLSWTWKTLSWRDDLSKFSSEWTSHYDSLTWSNDSQAKNSDIQWKTDFL